MENENVIEEIATIGKVWKNIQMDWAKEDRWRERGIIDSTVRRPRWSGQADY